MIIRFLAATGLAICVHAPGAHAYPTNECIDSLNHDVRLAAIADKVALGRSHETSAEMILLEQPARASEKRVLALWSRLRQWCFDLGSEYRRERVNPQHAALAGRLFDLHQRMLDELSVGETTYAEFNRRRVEIYLIAASLEAQLADTDAPPPNRQSGI